VSERPTTADGGDDTIRSTAALLVATIVAFVIANSPLGDVVHDGWARQIGFGLDAHDIVNDGLMALFFLVVGIELNVEFRSGTLRDPRIAAVPVAAAVGGMVMPAVLYLSISAGTPEVGGWGIPMATDVAFALGVLALAGRGAPPALRVFLLSLAVVDDLGAILVIAVAYSGTIAWGWLLAGCAAPAALWWLQRRSLGPGWLAVALVAIGWVCMFRSGVHATIAGVVAGCALSEPVGRRWESALDRFVRWVVLPLFAFANAGVELSTTMFGGTRWQVIVAVVVGLVVGKPAGIIAASWLAVRFGGGSLPPEVTWRQVAAVGALGGMGFTVALLAPEPANARSATSSATVRTSRRNAPTISRTPIKPMSAPQLRTTISATAPSMPSPKFACRDAAGAKSA